MQLGEVGVIVGVELGVGPGTPRGIRVGAELGVILGVGVRMFIPPTPARSMCLTLCRVVIRMILTAMDTIRTRGVTQTIHTAMVIPRLKR